jgi:hypothetical protein
VRAQLSSALLCFAVVDNMLVSSLHPLFSRRTLVSTFSCEECVCCSTLLRICMRIIVLCRCMCTCVCVCVCVCVCESEVVYE